MTKTFELDGVALCRAAAQAGADHFTVKSRGQALLFCTEAYYERALSLKTTLKLTAGYAMWVPLVHHNGILDVAKTWQAGFWGALRGDSLEHFQAEVARLEAEGQALVESTHKPWTVRRFGQVWDLKKDGSALCDAARKSEGWFILPDLYNRKYKLCYFTEDYRQRL